jgi:hypothetical protein
LFFSPTGYSRVVAAQQHLRDRQSAVFAGPRVLGKLQPSVSSGKRIFSVTALVSQNSWNQPHHGVDYHGCGHFATAKHEIADRQFVRLEYIDDPLIKPFIATAE